MATLPSARSLFRSLLRARATAFRGDEMALTRAQAEIRKHFDDHAHLVGEDARRKIEEGVEAESFIRLHVVQAKANDAGNFEMRIEPQHVDGEYEVPAGTGAGGCSGTGEK